MKDNALKIKKTSLMLAVVAAVLPLCGVILATLLTPGSNLKTFLASFIEIEPSLIFIGILLVFHKKGKAISWMPLVYLIYFLNFLLDLILKYKAYTNYIFSQNVSFLSFAYVNAFNFIILYFPVFTCLIAAVLAFFKKSPAVFLCSALVYYVFYFILVLINAFQLCEPIPAGMSIEMFLTNSVRPIVYMFFNCSSKILAFIAYIYYTIKTSKMKKEVVSE